MKLILNDIDPTDQFEACAASNDLGNYNCIVIKRNDKYFYVKRNKTSITVRYAKGKYEDAK